MRSALAALGGQITDIVYCPHHPDEQCYCRKPGTGMLETLQNRHGLRFNNVPFVGDTTKDLDCAAAIGASGVLVRTGKGEKTLTTLHQTHKKNNTPFNTPTYANLGEAVRDWLKQ
jgi:D-glycero-D-manno-heptose 1,7-bisphosphate phosphatase